MSNPIITGMVITVYEHYGFISVDNACKREVSKDVMFPLSSVIDGRLLEARDRVELEAVQSPKGWNALWVKYVGHGPITAKTEELVEGTGTVKHIYPHQAGFSGYIKPDVPDASDVMFSKASSYPDCRIGDRVSFIARENSPGKWRAKLVRKMDNPPSPVRDWRDSWKEDAR